MTPLNSLESLLVWIREKPSSYCRTLGELDAVLYYLHMIWARFTNRDHELRAALTLLREEMEVLAADSLLPAETHSMAVDIDGPELRRLVYFWQEVDHRMGCHVRTDRW